MSLGAQDELIGLTVINQERSLILAVTEYGYGKKTVDEAYRRQTRGGKGVKTLQVTDKNGPLVALRSVNNDLDLLVVTDKGMVIRMAVDQISETGRATQGVRLIRLQDGHKVSSIALLPKSEIEEDGGELEEVAVA
jgi:DNA gyrase subunit A